jgi:hypothetical protein
VTHNPHDALVKAVFGTPENARGEFKAALPPELSDGIDWATLKRESGSFVDKELTDTHTDLLFSASLQDFRALLYIVFEHKSYAKTLLPLDMARYCLDDLTQVTDAALRQRELSPFARLALFALRDARTRGKLLNNLSNWTSELELLNPADRGTLMHYICEVDPTTAEDVDAKLTQDANMARSSTKTTFQILFDEGKLEGMLEGQAAIIQRQLRLKFGDLTAPIEARLQKATPEELDLWAERILFAQSIEGVIGEP